MAVRTGTQLKGTDLPSIETAVDTCISSPTVANGQALVTTCESVFQNTRDSAFTIVESGAGAHSTAGARPAQSIG
jgi:hypothetical protein